MQTENQKLLQRDTIPKPGGLGSGGLPRALCIKHTSSKYRVSVKYSSRRRRTSHYNSEGIS
jgi:hypothetical protein